MRREFSAEVGVSRAAEAARLLAAPSDVARVMEGVALSSEAGWILSVDWETADDPRDRRAIENVCLDAVRRPGSPDEVVRRLEVAAGLRDVVFRWDDRMESVALWRADGRPIDIAAVAPLALASGTARLPLRSRAHRAELLRLLRLATCRTGAEVAAHARSLEGVAAALVEPWDTPDEIARVLLLARAEALSSLRRPCYNYLYRLIRRIGWRGTPRSTSG